MIALALEGEEDGSWRAQARCRDGAASLTSLFFSEQLDDIARAKAFCAECPVKLPCLRGALARREPWGVWGGQLLSRGKVLAQKRKRGRPALPRDPRTGEIVRDPVRVAELRAAADQRARAEVAMVEQELVARTA
jgi:WhiB family redox-sensing transcriptional regulator